MFKNDITKGQNVQICKTNLKKNIERFRILRKGGQQRLNRSYKIIESKKIK